jgi:hypothetical protein
MKIFNMNIEPSDLKDLKIIAAKQETTAAAIIRKMIKEFIKKNK